MRKNLGSLCALLAAGLLGGCAHMNKSIEQRVEVGEQCRIATALPAQNPTPNMHLASIFLGNVGYCDVGQKDTLLAVCSFKQIRTRYIDYGAGGRAAIDAKLTELDGLAEKLRLSLIALQDKILEADKQYANPAKVLAASSYDERTALLQKYKGSLQEIQKALQAVRDAQAALYANAAALQGALGQQAQIEFASWNSNLHAQLSRLEQLLSGDVNIVWRAGLQDQVLTHVGRRSLELLHGSLKPADLILGKLDDKSHGTLSVGYLTFGDVVQNGVNKAYGNVKTMYAKRIGASEDFDKSRDKLEPFFVELRRAACDNLLEGTRFSMLTEVVDTMLITQITADYKLPEKINPPAGGGTGGLAGPATASGGANDPVVPPSPLAVYATNEWMARQQLLGKKIAASLAATAAKDNAPVPIGIVSVDEGMVRQIAEAATAKSLDDATRIFPSMLTNQASREQLDAAMAGSVTVNVAEAAVSHASMVLAANFSASNTNTFNPSNYNNVAPVINFPSPVTKTSEASLCTGWDGQGTGASCSVDGKDYVITFPGRSYDNDSCVSGSILPALEAAGRNIALYRDRHGTDFQAIVSGYASNPPARLARCPAALRAPEAVCRYSNSRRAVLDVAGCVPPQEGNPPNRTLSAARAGNAAMKLESAARGAVLVTGLAAQGTDSAGTLSSAANFEQDRTVMIRLQPVQSL